MTLPIVTIERGHVVIDKNTCGIADPVPLTAMQAKALAYCIAADAKRNRQTVFPVTDDFNFVWAGKPFEGATFATALLAAAKQLSEQQEATSPPVHSIPLTASGRPYP